MGQASAAPAPPPPPPAPGEASFGGFGVLIRPVFISQAGNGQVKSFCFQLGTPPHLPSLLSTHWSLLAPPWLLALDNRVAEISSTVQPHPEGLWEEGRYSPSSGS